MDQPVPYGQPLYGNTGQVGGRAGVGQPGTDPRNIVTPGFTLPASGSPGYGQYGYTQPGYVQPGYIPTVLPGYLQPGYGQPGFGQPGIGQPGIGQPGFGQPGFGQPGYVQPGYVQPGYEQPCYGQPGCELLGYGQRRRHHKSSDGKASNETYSCCSDDSSERGRHKSSRRRSRSRSRRSSRRHRRSKSPKIGAKRTFGRPKVAHYHEFETPALSQPPNSQVPGAYSVYGCSLPSPPQIQSFSPQPTTATSAKPPSDERSPSIGQLLLDLENEDSQVTKTEEPASESTSSLKALEKLKIRRHRQDIYEDEYCELCALNPCIAVALAVGLVLMVVLGAAFNLLRAASVEFKEDVSAGQLGIWTVEGVEEAYSSSDSLSTTQTGGDCATDACLWEGDYLFKKLDPSVDPCRDFYSHVCSEEWFEEKGVPDKQPYRYRARASVMLDVWRLLQAQPLNVTSSFASQAALLARGCVDGVKRDTLLADLRKVFTEFGMPGWPYEETLPSAEVHDVAKVADKLLKVSSFFSLSARERPTDSEIAIHLDSPPILLRRHQNTFPDKNVKAYTEFVLEALSLYKTANSTTQQLALELVRLEQKMSEAADHSSRSVPVVHVTRRIAKLSPLANWNWQTYFRFFLQGNAGRHSSTKLVVLDAFYFDRLPDIFEHTASRTLVNYVGYKVAVHLSPLLPGSRAAFLVPLSHDNHPVEGVSDRLQACLSFLDRLYPFGVRSLVWTTVLNRTKAVELKGLAEDLSRLEDQARFEMKQVAATAPWMLQYEADEAVLKMERMRVSLLPSKAELPYEPFDLPVSGNDSRLLGRYYDLSRLLRAQYWSTSDLKYFREPLSPVEDSFQTGFSYDPEQNAVEVLPATISFVSRISRRFDPVSLPFLLGPALRGMFSAMDIDGSHIDAGGNLEHWWSPESERKYLERAKCIQNSFAFGAMRLIRDGLSSALSMKENVIDAAVLRPLFNIYQRMVGKSERSAEIPGQPRNLTSRRLFFVNWATTLCEPGRGPSYLKKQLRYKLAMPAKLRVNVALSRFRPFAEAFECQPGSRMSPAAPCAFW